MSAFTRSLLRGAILVLVGVAAVLSVPRSAHAWTATLRNVPLTGPVLAGDHVYWAQRERSGRDLVLRVASAQRGPRTLQTLVARRRHGDSVYEPRVALAASARKVVVDVAQIDVARRPTDPNHAPPVIPVLAQSLGAVPGARLAALAPRCRARGPLDVVAVDGTAAVHRDAACGLVVRDLDDPLGASLALPAGSYAPQLAGRYVAVLGDWAPDRPDRHRTGVLVLDRVTGHEVHAVSPDALPGRITSLGIDADGTIVATFDIGSHSQVWTASLGDPLLRPITALADGYHAARIVRGRVVMARAPDRRPGGVHQEAELVALDRVSGATRTIAAAVDTPIDGVPFAFDGRRVSWLTRGCGEVRIHVAAIDDAPQPAPRADRACPLQLAARPVVSARGVRLRFSCAGMTTSCWGFRTTIRTRGRHSVLLARSTSRSHDAGGRATLTLTRTGRAWLRAHPSTRVRISTSLNDVYGEFLVSAQTRLAPHRSIDTTLESKRV